MDGFLIPANPALCREIDEEENPRHGEGKRNLDCSPYDHADPGGDAHAARVNQIALGPEFADRSADKRHEEKTEKPHEHAEHRADKRTDDARF
mgnify:CR=1 FL=1